MSLFDVYFAVDWSSRNAPSPVKPSVDTLWISERLSESIAESDTTLTPETYWRTRQECIAYLYTRLLHHTRLGRRVLLGFDFPYGYPAGTALALGLSGEIPPWRCIWNELASLIVDKPDNSNNRFQVAATLNARCGNALPGPFWGCPVGSNLPALMPTSPVYPYAVRPGLQLEGSRQVDCLEPGMQPAWKLYGTGSAGGQALVGIPYLCRLRDDPSLVTCSRVWPFETGFTPVPTPAHGPFILHAEIWPGVVSDLLDPTIPIRDHAQVRAVTTWFSQLDATDQLGTLFSTPSQLSQEILSICIAEEGWSPGAGRKKRKNRQETSK